MSIGAGGGPGSARQDAVAGYDRTFCIDDLWALRRLAAEHGRQAGLSPARLTDFVLAVNEAATNAVCRTSERARLRLWVTGDDVCCEVHGGSWISAQPAPVSGDADSLRLWVMWQVCREVRLSYGPRETSVLLTMGVR
jgi:hypothetical protein